MSAGATIARWQSFSWQDFLQLWLCSFCNIFAAQSLFFYQLLLPSPFIPLTLSVSLFRSLAAIHIAATCECQTRIDRVFTSLQPHSSISVSSPPQLRSQISVCYSFRSFHWKLFKFDLYNIFRLENFVVLIICLLDALCSFRQNEWMNEWMENKCHFIMHS